ncbi:LacI family DNA-binding transcriptional regulator [Arthrobacter tecti]
MATLSDVATAAGVSISVVSRVLSNAPSARVGEGTRKRIEEAAQQLDYRPNFAARALKLSRSKVIALVVPDLTNAIFTELMRGVEDAVLERDYTVLIGRAEAMQPGGEAIKKLIGEVRIDGMLVQHRDTATREEIAALSDARIPVVFINSIEANHVGSVVLEDEAAARIATEHLINLGHSRIGLITGRSQSYTAGRRAAGFRAEMHAANLPVEPGWMRSVGYEPQRGREAFRHIMSQHRRPTALYIANVNAAIGALAEARSMNLRVPEDVSIIAMHDSWTAENTWPPLTTVKMPLYEMGRRSVEVLWSRMTSSVTEDVVITDPQPQIILRESTAPPSS